MGLLLVGVGGMALGLAGGWGFLAHRGVLRWLAGAVAVLGPLGIAVLYAGARLLWVVLVFALLWLAALAPGGARSPQRRPAGPREYEVPPPRAPVPDHEPALRRRQGGPVRPGRTGRALGAEVVLLDGPGRSTSPRWPAGAVAGGADLLGVAGGDGTQALVAGIAAEHGLPFLVISAGTRNHFALDLGLDREDPATCLDALHRRRRAARRPRADRRPDVRQQRLLRRLRRDRAEPGVPRRQDRHHAGRCCPTCWPGSSGAAAAAAASADVAVDGPQAVLVSNNPYGAGDLAGLGRRGRGSTTGVLGVLAVTVDSAVEAVGLLRGRPRPKALDRSRPAEVVIDADAAAIPVGIDGEAVTAADAGALHDPARRAARAGPAAPARRPCAAARDGLDPAAAAGALHRSAMTAPDGTPLVIAHLSDLHLGAHVPDAVDVAGRRREGRPSGADGRHRGLHDACPGPAVPRGTGAARSAADAAARGHRQPRRAADRAPPHPRPVRAVPHWIEARPRPASCGCPG